MSHGSSLRYVFVWLALLALTVTTYLASRLELGRWHLATALLIAMMKTALVALFFMHLSSSPRINRAVFVISLAFVALLIAGVVGDAMTRNSYALPPESWPAPMQR